VIDLSAAGRLLDFGKRLPDPQRAQEQLAGAVALHNLLEREKVAYLADEVGMGKTLVAIGALALFRHFNPSFRVLVIAPKENIQRKWMNELRRFVTHNVRFPDLRVKGLDGAPVRPLTFCRDLPSLLHEAILDPNQDFFLRMPSFSLGVSGKDKVDPDSIRKLRGAIEQELPWIDGGVFDLRNKTTFKDNVARAICCALPRFDLVIVDEAHNLKHGFSDHVAARNRVLALTLGRPDVGADPRLFRGYGPRATRVLLLSATPVEDSYTQLWNQLDVFGRGAPFERLCAPDASEEEKREIAARFLVRRVTSLKIGGQVLTKNLYRREWRHGGVLRYDEPVVLKDARQQLTVALVQKKVSELLGDARFNASFQIGMLASFESFLETTRTRDATDEALTFDDSEQTEDSSERDGIDVADVNRLASSYRRRFGEELPHPKMDALVDSLAQSWEHGRKSLVFVRRIASVRELKDKLDERYNHWLIDRLRRELPAGALPRFERLVTQFLDERTKRIVRRTAASGEATGPRSEEKDLGGVDTFFAWFFRGEGPAGVISGANVQRRFNDASARLGTFFEDNLVAEVLGCAPGDVERSLAELCGLHRAAVHDEVRLRSARFLSRAKRPARGDRFWATQAAAIEWLTELPGPHQARAAIVWQELFQGRELKEHASDAPDIGDWLAHRTFFTELRSRPELRDRLWPETGDAGSGFRDRQLRGQLLASAARLGHGLIDLYVMTIRRIGSLELRAQEDAAEGTDGSELEPIHAYLDLLEEQMRTPRAERRWGAFDELADCAEQFELLLDVNPLQAPDARDSNHAASLPETARMFGTLLGQQQPVGGMHGKVNGTLVKQFRMPGYPLVLVSTDLLQEGEDLHTFCSDVHHYGIAWAPSAMEQRIGRIDRVRSQTDRRLASLKRTPAGEELLQVYFPYLEDTIEVIQVQRVLARMNTFLRLMHEGLVAGGVEERTVQPERELARGLRLPEQIREPLRSGFPIQPELLEGDVRSLASAPEDAERIEQRFSRLELGLPGLQITWEDGLRAGRLWGTVQLPRRIQPFTLVLRTLEGRPLVRCISPIGRVIQARERDVVVDSARKRDVRLGAVRIQGPTEHSYDLTVEDDVLLSDDPATDAVRVAQLLRRTVALADQLEQEHLPGQDAPLEAFRKDLANEGTDDG